MSNPPSAVTPIAELTPDKPGLYTIIGQVTFQVFNNDITVPLIIALSTSPQSFTDLAGTSYDPTSFFCESTNGILNYNLPASISSAGGPYTLSMLQYSLLFNYDPSVTPHLYLVWGLNSTAPLAHIRSYYNLIVEPYVG